MTLASKTENFRLKAFSRIARHHSSISLAIIALASGFCLYFFTRTWNFVFFANWFGVLQNPFLEGTAAVPDFIKYNLPDGLWLLSGLWFLRAVWPEGGRACGIWRLLFCLLAVFFELAQRVGLAPGTFDFLDLAIMAVCFLVESALYSILILLGE
jgi:hypothetical protein